MQCPKCDGQLKPVQFQDMTVNRCDGCSGLWFDLREREKLASRPGSERIDTGAPEKGLEHNDVQGRVDCPVCHTQMVKMVDHQQPHIWFESCNICGGVFFDAGEFRDYKEYSITDFFRGLTTRERR